MALDHGRLSCPQGLSSAEKLGWLATSLRQLIDRRRPDIAALESLFHGVNSRSLIVLAQARGALLVPLSERGMPVREYSPAQVKAAVTGYGRADKAQVQKMVRLLLGLGAARLSADASDALAVAICAANHHRSEAAREGPGGGPKRRKPQSLQGLSGPEPVP